MSEVRTFKWERALLAGHTWLVYLFLYVPILVLIIFSFNEAKQTAVWQGFTLDWYAKLAENERILRSLKNSLIVAGFTTLISTIVGTSAALALGRHRFRGQGASQALLYLPIVIPEIVMGFAVATFFGVINWRLGLSSVVAAHIAFCIPYVAIVVRARLAGFDRSLEEAAMDLGATPVRAFWLVIVPCLRPAILSGGLMAFTLSMDEIIVTFFTSSAQSATLPLLVFGMAKVGLNPMLNALSALFILATVAFVLFTEHLRRLSRR